MQVINAMGGQIERQQDNNACLAYWLSNTVTLLYLLQRNIKPASGGVYTSSRLRSSPATSRQVHLRRTAAMHMSVGPSNFCEPNHLAVRHVECVKPALQIQHCFDREEDV